MVSPHGIKLAVHLISSYFGDIVSKVCECLLRRGTISQVQLIRYTELSKENVKNSLLVLQQHNCVQAFNIQQPGGFGEAAKIVTQYMALYDNIIHHMRFPKFLAIVSDEFGQECMDIFEGFLQHGRLSFNQSMDRYKDKHTGENSSSVHENLNKLVEARFIERCPFIEPLLEPEEPAKKRTQKSKMGDVQTLETRALVSATRMESERFSVELSKDSTPQVVGEKVIGEKRKLDCLESKTVENEILWRVNFEEFIRRLRQKSCVSHVTTNLDSVAGIVLSAIFEASRSKENEVKMQNTVPLDANTIFNEAMKSEEGRQSLATKERARASLVQLGCQNPALGIDEEVYSVDLKKIIDQAQAQEVESIVLQKYGREAYRIFRLLLSSSESERLYETDKISSTTFVEKKDALKLLFQLWKDNFLHMEKLGSDPQKAEILLWKLNKHTVWEQVLDDMYHAALNLKLRLAHELLQAKDILQVLKGKTSDEVLQKRKRVGNKWKVLEASLMILDDAIMLFHHF